MILAAGLGTRLKPFTDMHPKALAEINNKTLLQHNIEYLLRFDIDEIIVNVHHFAEQVVDKINKNNGWGAKITISNETDLLLETGGGLKKASWFFENEKIPFVLLNVDILTDFDLKHIIDFHNVQNNLATLFVSSRETSRYFLFDENFVLSGWKNSKTQETKITRNVKNLKKMAFNGLHVISPKIFSLIKQEGKFSIVDTYLDLSKTEIIKGYNDDKCKIIDVGKPDSIAMAEKLFI